MKNLTGTQLEAAHRLAQGENKSRVAKDLGVARNSLYGWLKRGDFQEAVKRARAGAPVEDPAELPTRDLEKEVVRRGLEEALKRLRENPAGVSSRDLATIVSKASKSKRVSADNLADHLKDTSLDVEKLEARIEKDPKLKKKILSLIENHGDNPTELQQSIERLFWSGKTRLEFIEAFYRRLARNVMKRRAWGERIKDPAAYWLSRGITRQIAKVEPDLMLDEDAPWSSLRSYLNERLGKYLKERTAMLDEAGTLQAIKREQIKRTRRSTVRSAPTHGVEEDFHEDDSNDEGGDGCFWN